MALVESRWQRIVTLCGLYFAQGVPWGFMLITLPSYLAYKFNIQDDEIGPLKAIILVPWSFKLIWAPLVDTFTLPSMGRRRPWILGAELLMALTLLGFIGLGDLSDKLRILLYMYFLHNCFASLQDVCTDAMAVDVLPPDEQGRMNGLMWTSKLIGKGVGAYVLSYVINWGGLEACVAVQVVLLIAIMFIPMLILERPGEKRFPWSRGKAAQVAGETIRRPGEVLRDILRAFSLVPMIAFLVFTLLKLIGHGINEVATNTLYTQQLNPVWSDIDYSRVSGFYATFLIIPAAVGGGWVADRFGRRIVLLIGFGGYAVVAALFAALPDYWSIPWVATSYLLASETLNAVGSVGFLSMGMRITWTKSAAIVFTTYMTLSNVSHIIGNYSAGKVRNLFFSEALSDAAVLVSYQYTFAVVAAMTLAPLLLLIWIRPTEVDDARRLYDAEMKGR